MPARPDCARALARGDSRGQKPAPWLSPRGLIARAAAAAMLGVWAIVCVGGDYDQRPELAEFIDAMVAEHGYERQRLQDIFSRAKRLERTLELIARPSEKSMGWPKYRSLFLNERRVNDGLVFWGEHRETLLRAQRQHRVPATLILAILGVETRYGGHTGKYSVLNSLTTLAFDYPRRAPFFRSQLEAFLQMTLRHGMDPHAIQGSYAGAIGYGQFMPSSYLHYAVDFDGDGRVDIELPQDAIGSIANYVARHGWREGQPVAVPALLAAEHNAALLAASLKPKLSVRRLAEEGFHDIAALPAALSAAVFALRGERTNEYWIGLHNFHVISRYNPSAMYAMAVHQLSERLAERISHAEWAERAP